MTTLEAAWGWYQATLATLQVTERLAEVHWEYLPWAGPLGRDPAFRDTTAEDLLGQVEAGRQPLDDLAVLVLFSVFESVVRGVVREQVEREAGGLRHPAVVHAVE